MELSFLSIITLWCHAKLVNWFNRMYMGVCAWFYYWLFPPMIFDKYEGKQHIETKCLIK